MNKVMQTILQRKSVRAYQKQLIGDNVKAEILKATLRAPTAGNMMLYSIIEVSDQSKKDMLATTCDNQPFIAKAPWVLLFLADYQRWYDYFVACGVPENNASMRKPQEGDMLLACCDALIAAQTAVIAAESWGIGSCYIGDIMENCEAHRQMFNLPRYTFPVCLLCFGYPTRGQSNRKQTGRFDERFIVSTDAYHRLTPEELAEMFVTQEQAFKGKVGSDGAGNLGEHYYRNKFNADFAIELNRSVKKWMEYWLE